MTELSSSAADRAQARLLRLAPYLIGRTRRGIVGSSRYAQRLREQIRNAAADSAFGSAARRQLLLRVDGASLRPDGGLLIDQLDKAPEAVQQALLELAASVRFKGRLFFTTESALPAFDKLCTLLLAGAGRWLVALP